MWPGAYYSGRDANRVSVEVALEGGAFSIRWPDGSVTAWPYAEVRLPAKPGPGDPVRLDHAVYGQQTPETLVFTAPGFLQALRAVAPAHLHVVPETSFWLKAGIAAALAVAIAGAGLSFGVPLLVDWLAARVPVEWEEELGKRLAEHIAPASQSCGERAAREVEQILGRLQPDGFSSPYRFHVTILKDPMVNAFALPGGQIAIFSGLLEKTNGPEELAGVLAHEMEHVVQRHSTRAVIRDLSLFVLLSAAFGDLSGVLGSARSLGQLHFQRHDEESADQRGMERMMAARIDPRAMVRAFRMLDSEADRAPRIARYLSTHPPIEDRVRRLEKQAAQWRGTAQPLLSGTVWKTVANACRP